MSNSPINKILAMRPQEEPRTSTGYQAFVDSGGRPQMGFALIHAGGDMDGFLYHNLDNLSYQTVEGMEYLSFTHRGKAVTLEGRALRGGFSALMRHTLMEIYERDGRPEEPGQPIITRLKVTVVG